MTPCAAAADGSDAVDAAWILKGIARPVPASTPFVEVRASKLLKAPLRLSGQYVRPDADTLVREVRAPYVETTTLRAGEATIARAGQAPRKFALSRVPELAGFQGNFASLLDGDRAGLERHYTLSAQGSRQRWTLTMVPKDAAQAARLQSIALYGRGSELRCIETRTVGNAPPQRTLLAGAAADAAGVEAAPALEALCHGDATR
ncbi:LolA-related protein [Lysobacter sp. GCM10012299]|uniref:LolA-related protein n=1 Tax=Lysobacter sp. GCM10012299 TaxID=3317333 RepID=UPI00361298E5